MAEDVFRSIRAASGRVQGPLEIELTALDLDPNGDVVRHFMAAKDEADIRFVKGDITNEELWSENIRGKFDLALFVGLSG